MGLLWALAESEVAVPSSSTLKTIKAQHDCFKNRITSTLKSKSKQSPIKQQMTFLANYGTAQCARRTVVLRVGREIKRIEPAREYPITYRMHETQNNANVYPQFSERLKKRNLITMHSMNAFRPHQL
jgi:hypothetical protein